MSNNNNNGNRGFKNSKLGYIYEYAGLIIIFTATLLFLYQAFNLINFENKDLPEVKIDRNSAFNFSETYTKIVENKKGDSLAVRLLGATLVLHDSIQVLNKKIELVTISNSDTESKVKTVASIAAVIIAIVGFFGFKSLNDIREHTIKNAEVDAQEIAKKTAEEKVKEFMESHRSKLAELEPLIKGVEEALGNRIDGVETLIGEVADDVSRLSNRVKVFEDGIGADEDLAFTRHTGGEKGAIDPDIQDSENSSLQKALGDAVSDSTSEFDEEDNGGDSDKGNIFK